MLSTSLPTLVPLAFAANAGVGYKNTIPEASQIGITNGAASLNDGFPPLTFVDTTAGGIAPFGQDFNGVLNLITQSIRAYNAGQGMTFNSTFASDSNVGGYPKGARLLASDGFSYWRSIIDNNTNDPEAVNTGWVPDTAWGSTSVAMSNANVTLTFLQAAKYTITITGVLTANLNLIFPAWNGVEWFVANNATGSFSVTCKTASGTGVSIPSGEAAMVYCDGTNILVSVNQWKQASNAEAQAFSSAIRVISPATLSAAFQGSNQLASANGYQKLPGGLIIQWGSGTYAAAGSGGTTVTLPMAFPNNTFCLSLARTDTSGLGGSIVTLSNSQIKIFMASSSSAGFWFAIGN